MCYFMTVGVGTEGAASLLDEPETRHRGPQLTIRPASNPSLLKLFPRGDRLFWVTSGPCSCDLYSQSRHSASDEAERQRDKYRAKGWSDAKIARALAQHSGASNMMLKNGTAARQLFTDLLQRLSACRGGVRVFAHFYRGIPDIESVSDGAQTRTDLGTLLDGSNFPEDTVIDIAPR